MFGKRKRGERAGEPGKPWTDDLFWWEAHLSGYRKYVHSAIGRDATGARGLHWSEHGTVSIELRRRACSCATAGSPALAETGWIPSLDNASRPREAAFSELRQGQ